MVNIQLLTFDCIVLFLSFGSDDSEDESPRRMQCHLMDKVGVAEGALCELTNELQLSVTVSISTFVLY